MKMRTRLTALIVSFFAALAVSLPALADVPAFPNLRLDGGNSLPLWLLLGIAGISLAVVVFLIIRSRRNRP